MGLMSWGTGPRRSFVTHCASSEARYHPANVGPIYGRYKKTGSLEMDESFLPVLWHKSETVFSLLGCSARALIRSRLAVRWSTVWLRSLGASRRDRNPWSSGRCLAIW